MRSTGAGTFIDRMRSAKTGSPTLALPIRQCWYETFRSLGLDLGFTADGAGYFASLIGYRVVASWFSAKEAIYGLRCFDVGRHDALDESRTLFILLLPKGRREADPQGNHAVEIPIDLIVCEPGHRTGTFY